MKFWSDMFFCSLTVIFFSYSIVFVTLKTGERFEFGTFGEARPLVAADGLSYIDRTPIDPLTLELMRTRHYDAFSIAMSGLAILGLFCTIIMSIRMRRSRKELQRWRELNKSLKDRR